MLALVLNVNLPETVVYGLAKINFGTRPNPCSNESVVQVDAEIPTSL